MHGNYSLSDVTLLDPDLATEIRILSQFFGYDIEKKMASVDQFGKISDFQHNHNNMRSDKLAMTSPIRKDIDKQLYKCY